MEKTNAKKDEMISFGAGVNSVAMTIMLVEDGWRGPIVFADTGSEMPETYCYIRYFEQQYLMPRGMEIIQLEPGSRYHGRRFNVSLEQFCLASGLIPLLAARWCSIEYKRKPCLKWMEEHGIGVQFLGISSDEPRRVRYDDSTKRYPLVEHNSNRSECLRIIQRAGLELPGKSSCFFCPGQRIGRWRDMYHNHRELWDRAVAMEENATLARRNETVATLRPDGQPLVELAKRRWQGQIQMDLSRWLPCACRL